MMIAALDIASQWLTECNLRTKELTPKVFANSSPGFPTLGYRRIKGPNAEGVGQLPTVATF